MDLYRVEEEEEIINLGLDELLYGNGICLVEWIDRLSELPEKYTRIIITVNHDSGAREIEIRTVGSGVI